MWPEYCSFNNEFLLHICLRFKICPPLPGQHYPFSKNISKSMHSTEYLGFKGNISPISQNNYCTLCELSEISLSNEYCISTKI